ncbi:hypothetical protein [Rhizobium sp. RAF56]|uniref:hypothetical protein n=1 Tax=Rhizobium sp. RAF56 TaxID=3233062 RepID=UPI003F9CBE35
MAMHEFSTILQLFRAARTRQVWLTPTERWYARTHVPPHLVDDVFEARLDECHLR